MEDKEEKKVATIELPDYTSEDDMELEVGVLYQGSFKIDRTGKISVRPYKQGTKPNNLKKVVDGDRHAIFMSKKLIRIVISIQRTERKEINKAYQEIVLDCYKDLNDLKL